MRIVIHEYANGDRYIYQTTERGEMIKEIEGSRRPGERVRAVVEVLCDDNQDGKTTLLQALQRALTLVNPQVA